MLPATNYVFFGSPDFAAIILEKIIAAGFIPQAVVCNPDKPVGRKKILTPPPVKVSILKQIASIKERIKILQPETTQDMINTSYQLQATNPELFVVAAYAKILPKEVLEIPRLGSVGVHPSLLPKYRGPSPIQSAILNGDIETGITLFLMDEKVDHGPIISNQKLAIGNQETTGSLSKKLAELGAKILIETLTKFLTGEIKPQPQDETAATYTKKFVSDDAYVKPEDLERAQTDGGEIAKEIERKIRALNPEPGVWTLRQTQDKRMKILEAHLIDDKLKITKIQVEGKKAQEI